MRRYPFTSPLPPPRLQAAALLCAALVVPLSLGVASTTPSAVDGADASATQMVDTKAGEATAGMAAIDAPAVAGTVAPESVALAEHAQTAPVTQPNNADEPVTTPARLDSPLLTPGEQQRQVIAQCFVDAGKRFKVDPYLLLSIKYVESGKSLDPAITGRNTNGTIDMGLMQINSIWLKNAFVQAAGIKKSHLYDPCININVGAWILSQEIARHGVQEGIGRYHSATPKFKIPYRAKVLAQYAKLAKRKAQAKTNTVVASKD